MERKREGIKIETDPGQRDQNPDIWPGPEVNGVNGDKRIGQPDIGKTRTVMSSAERLRGCSLDRAGSRRSRSGVERSKSGGVRSKSGVTGGRAELNRGGGVNPEKQRHRSEARGVR
jgi:hypothetical protein